MKKVFKGKRGSEVIQNLIVIAIMGALAITAISAIATKIQDKNDAVIRSIDGNLTKAANDAGAGL